MFVIDDLAKAPDSIRQSVLAGVETVRRRRACGLLMTAQTADAARNVPEAQRIELLAPTSTERRALLEAYGAPDILDRCEAFISPLELSLAAEHAATLTPNAGTPMLLDLHVDHLVDGHERLRSGLRATARIMHDTVTSAPTRPDVARALRREHNFTDHDLDALWACPIITITQGRVTFRHERVEHFLAAESLLLEITDPDMLAAKLNSPRCAALRADAVALETDAHRLSAMLVACQSAELLVSAASGRLGALAAKVATSVLMIALDRARAHTSVDNVSLEADSAIAVEARWTVHAMDEADQHAQWEAVGQLLIVGHFVELTGRLLDETDTMCARFAETTGSRSSTLADSMFAATYVFTGERGLPATTIVRSAIEAQMTRHASPEAAEVALELLRRSDPPGLGTLYLAGELLRRGEPQPFVADVILRCLMAGRYHLVLLGLELAEAHARRLGEAEHQRVLNAVRRLPTGDMFLDSAIIETLDALGDVVPAKRHRRNHYRDPDGTGHAGRPRRSPTRLRDHHQPVRDRRGRPVRRGDRQPS